MERLPLQFQQKENSAHDSGSGEVNFKSAQRTYTTQPLKKPISQKMDREPRQTCFQKRHTDGQQTYEKMLNINNHQGNENQNFNEF